MMTGAKRSLEKRDKEIAALRENQKEADRRLMDLDANLREVDTELRDRIWELERSTPFVPFTLPWRPEKYKATDITLSDGTRVDFKTYPESPVYDRMNNRTIWKDAAGVSRTIATMDIDHVENCMRMLRSGSLWSPKPNVEQTPVMRAFKLRLANEALRLNAVTRDPEIRYDERPRNPEADRSEGWE